MRESLIRVLLNPVYFAYFEWRFIPINYTRQRFPARPLFPVGPEKQALTRVSRRKSGFLIRVMLGSMLNYQ